MCPGNASVFRQRITAHTLRAPRSTHIGGRSKKRNAPSHCHSSIGEIVSVPVYLNVEEVIERYRDQISEGTLRNWRSLRIGPSFIKIGKAVLYPADELKKWDRSNLIVCRRSRSLVSASLAAEEA
jgi:hypothetical protein